MPLRLESLNPVEAIKKFVQDLVTLRLGTSDAGPVPQAYYRINSVGQEVPIEDDWNFPAWDGDALVPEVSLQSSQHGYLEELNSTARTVSKLPSMTSTTSTASAEKGKAKANPVGEVDDLSNISVIGVDPSPKNPPIPYYVGDLRNQDIRSSSTPALAESTPRAPFSEVENTAFETKEPDVQDAFVDDPPLPTIEPQASASLPDDISNFFTSLCSLISSHPEVSESFHNIVRNASNGTYWRRHREALSQAAAEISHSSETVVRDAEAEAGRKVFSALDALFRPFSQVAGARPQSTEPTSSNKDASGKEGGDTATRVLSPAPVPPTLPGEKGTTEAQHDVPKQDRNTFIGRTTDWQSFLTPFPQPISPYAVHIPPVHSVAPGIVPPPPPPPPPPPIPYPPATGVPSPFHPPYVAPITPGTFTPFHMSLPTPASPRHAEFHSRSPMKEMHYDPDSSPPSPAGPYTAEMAELKAKVSVAKSMYRAEKARYLQERHHARRRERGRFRHGGEQSDAEETKPFDGLQSMIDAAGGPVSQVISNARGAFPQIGVISIPGPFSPAQRHVSFRDGVDDFRSRSVKRIVKQLADMGFTENQHPGLANKVSSRLPPNGSITKDIEDGIVTSLLEELLPLSSPVASGSGVRSKGRN